MENLADCKLDPCDVAVTVGPHQLQATVRAGKHTILVDEPVGLGGQDTGPHPYDLILSALGSCLAITLRMYANHKQWPLEKIEARLQFQTKHDEWASEADFADIREIVIRLGLYGNLSEEQVKRLTAITKKCPVHKSLAPAFPIKIQVEVGGPEFQ